MTRGAIKTLGNVGLRPSFHSSQQPPHESQEGLFLPVQEPEHLSGTKGRGIRPLLRGHFSPAPVSK